MRPALTLYARIAGLVVFNLLVLSIGAYLLRNQFKPMQTDSLRPESEKRLQTVADRVFTHLSTASRANWTPILVTEGDAESMTLLLFDDYGGVMGGPMVSIPTGVFEEVKSTAGSRMRPQFEDPAEEFLFGTNGVAIEPAQVRGTDVAKEVKSITRFESSDERPDFVWFGIRGFLSDSGRRGPWPVTLAARARKAEWLEMKPVNWWLPGSLGIAVSLLMWLPFARKLSGSLTSMTAATEDIAEGRFDIEVDERRSDELGRLGGAINKMADKLEGYVSGQKRFLGDTAHELCSPLARMQMAVGILENKATDDQRDYVSDLKEEVQHMSDLVNELLSFSKASLQPEDVKIQAVNVKQVVEVAVRRETQGKADVKVTMSEDTRVMANTQLLARAVGNLLRNAVRYAGHCGPVGVTVEARDAHVYIVVWDSGPGIPDQHVDMIFDPFYRPDASRTATTGGVGLGMAIVKTCVETCGGQVICKNRKSQGLKVIIRLKRIGVTDATGVSKGEFNSSASDS